MLGFRPGSTLVKSVSIKFRERSCRESRAAVLHTISRQPFPILLSGTC